MEPKIWDDSEIIELMVKEAHEYRKDVQLRQFPIDYRDMMECVLSILKEKGLIEYTP